jgi:ketosteroid isomerase-like protein
VKLKLKRLSMVGMLLAALVFVATLRSKANSPESPDAAIRQVLAMQQEAWNHANVDAFLKGYWESEELTFSGSGGITRGYNGLRDRYKKTYPDKAAMGKLDFSGLEIRPLGADAALVLGHWHLARSSGDIEGVFSLVFQRFPQGWRIIHDHTSIVPPEAGKDRSD